jgi:alpha-tubulin suppressor-like RCC1 family protein
LLLVGVAASLPHLACELVFPTHLVEAGTGCTDTSDTSTDPLNCGSCGNACAQGAGCFLGVCGGMQVTQITAGLHACALVKAGAVFCWGDNLYGETGSATTQSCGADQTPCVATPTQVAGLAPDVVAVRAGFYSTCALERDGSVWCWGQNQYGQLGAVTATGTQSTPVQVTLASSPIVQSIDVGFQFACAVDVSGGLRCWGHDDYGELGVDLEGGSTSLPVTVKVADASITAVSTGLDPHACALLGGGQVACWGQNQLGSLGHDPATDPSCPPGMLSCSSTPTVVAGLAGLAAVRAASGVTCALAKDGGVWCWGDDGLGQFGDGVASQGGDAGAGGGDAGSVGEGGDAGAAGDAGESGAPFVPQPAAQRLSFVALDARSDFALALDADGGVWAWGSSSRGALGNSSITGSSCANDFPCVPQPVKLTPFGSAPVVQISAGQEFALALESDGTVWAWGANVDGRLGHAPGAGDAGDLMTCGAPVQDEICNPVPGRVVFP